MIAAGALALSAIVLVPTPANAEPKQSEAAIKKGCTDIGGTYTHDAGTGLSTCVYKDYYGDTQVDIWLDGVITPRGVPPQGPKTAPQPPVPEQGVSPQQPVPPAAGPPPPVVAPRG
jgi:hypothetical protein